MSQSKAQLLDPQGDLTLPGLLIGVGATFSGNVSIGGTLTKQDVTNVDSIGIITARSGVNISGGNLQFNGTNVINSGLALYNLDSIKLADSKELKLGSSDDLKLYHDGNHSYIHDTGTGTLRVQSSQMNVIKADGSETMAIFVADAEVGLFFNNSKKIETTNTGAVVTGICTATSFSGSGEGLTRTTPYSHRNVIVNGGCLVAQRGTSSASADFASVDRMKMSVTNTDQLAFLQKQTSDGPDGFSKCFEFDVTTVENALDADDLVYMRYAVEAQDLIPFFNANGSGKNFTLSFYVKAHQAGTYQVGIYKDDATAQFITKTYTIASSGTWQRVVLNFTGDTGTSGINADNGLGFQISFMLAAGTNYTSGSEQPTWGGWPGNPGFAAGQAVNTLSSTDNYWRITGIQLELGDIATPFEHRSLGEELARCQRYYYVLADYSDPGSTAQICNAMGYSTSQVEAVIHFPTVMRSSPSLVQGTGSAYMSVVNASGQVNFNSWIIYHPSPRNCLIYQNSGMSGSTATGATYRAQLNNANAYVHFNAEI